jgi:sugar transferase (PEP-CTERM/EpsH1 system associated)
MRIFVILPRIPYPLEKGDKLRAFHQVKALSKNNEIILCALNHNQKLDQQEAFSKLQPYCRSINFIDLPWYAIPFNIIRAFFKHLPLQVGYFYNARANKKIQKLFDEYKPDRVYCQLLRTAEYGVNLPAFKTIDYQDVFSYGVKRRIEKAPFWMKPILKLEYKRLLAYENKMFDLFNEKTIISLPDRKLIRHPNRDKIHIIPNGVDHDFFSPMEKPKEHDVVFTGNMSYPPNIDAAGFLVKEVMPLVWKKMPQVKIMLAGANPDNKVKALESEKVKVSGWMDDIRDAYASSIVFIAPMRIGTGLQNKLLEAMSMKIPSITTPLANDALQAENGKEILIGKDAAGLAQHIIDLLSNEEANNDIAAAGYNFVHQRYSWYEASVKLENAMKIEG